MWVRARRICGVSTDSNSECLQSYVRRTVWAGSRELYEIQAPDSVGTTGTREYDTQTLPLFGKGGPNGSYDPNPYYGIVAYTYGLVLDRPLSITRVNLRNYQGSSWLPFSIVPLWTPRGYADTSFFAATGASNCVAAGQCVALNYPETYFAPAYGAITLIDTLTFAGTLLNGKSDHSGLLYRRNRYYDPETGRFTQADPIGLAGGLNAYGFAAGDPVNFSDPFGLCPVMPCRSPDDGMNNRPLPPGVDERDVTWNPKGWYDLPDGTRIRPHPEDETHWDHWEIYEPGKKKPQNYPEKKNKPWPGQKVKPYGDQSGVDPWPLISPYTIRYNLKEIWKEFMKSIPSTAPQPLPGPAGFPLPGSLPGPGGFPLPPLIPLLP